MKEVVSFVTIIFACAMWAFCGYLEGVHNIVERTDRSYECLYYLQKKVEGPEFCKKIPKDDGVIEKGVLGVTITDGNPSMIIHTKSGKTLNFVLLDK